MTTDKDWPDCDDTVSTPRPIAEKRAQVEQIIDGAFTAKKVTVEFIRKIKMEMKNSALKELHELQMQIQKRLDERSIEETYRHAFRLGSQFDNEVIEKVSDALRFDTVAWLIKNGYELADVPKLFTQSFDYGCSLGVAIKIDAIKEQHEFPIAVRMLLMLLQSNKQLADELEARCQINANLDRRLAKFERPSFSERFRRLFGKARPEPEPEDDDDDDEWLKQKRGF